MAQNSKRLESLDILRGFDMFLLVCLQPILMSIGQIWDNPTYHSFLHQFDHEVWEGLRIWDLIMPLFLFMTGVSIPFSLDNKRENSKNEIYQHLFRRFIILWVIGMFMQGNLLGLNFKNIKLFSNTLQSIAIGYLITSILYLNFKIKTVAYIIISLLAIYTIPFLINNDFSEQNNFAILLDKQILGYFMDGAYWIDNNNWKFSSGYNYSWIWSSLTFIVTVALGCFCGKIIKDNRNNSPNKTLVPLLILGVGCLIAGFLIGLYIPIIKRIWSSSMTLVTGGYCILILTLFYFIIDVKQWGAKFNWLKIYGMNSILAYVLGEHLNFRSIVHVFTYGLENHFPAYKDQILVIGNYLIIFLILRYLYKKKIIVKI